MVFKTHEDNEFGDIESLPLLEIGDSAKITVDLEDKSEDDLFFEDEFKEVNNLLLRIIKIII